MRVVYHFDFDYVVVKMQMFRDHNFVRLSRIVQGKPLQKSLHEKEI